MESSLTRRICKICLRRLFHSRTLTNSFSSRLASPGHLRLASLGKLPQSSRHSVILYQHCRNLKKSIAHKPDDSDKKKTKDRIPDPEFVTLPAPIGTIRFETAKNYLFKLTGLLFAIIVSSIGSFILHLSLQKRRARVDMIVLNRQEAIKHANVGGAFELIDTEGKTVTEKEYLGKWLLLYFGFTHCPDICPDEMDKATEVVEAIDENKNLPNLQPVFVTIDPDRDTKDVIKTYLADFHPKFVGLTGNDEQIANACRSYKVYRQKGPENDEGEYIVDHSILTFLVDPSGQFTDYFAIDVTASQAIKMVEKRMKQYEIYELVSKKRMG